MRTSVVSQDKTNKRFVDKVDLITAVEWQRQTKPTKISQVNIITWFDGNYNFTLK